MTIMSINAPKGPLVQSASGVEGVARCRQTPMAGLDTGASAVDDGLVERAMALARRITGRT